MNRIKIIVFIVFILCHNEFGYATSYIYKTDYCTSIKLPVIVFVSNDTIIKDKLQYPPLKRDFKRLGLNMVLFVGASVTVVGILWILPENISNWNKEAITENGIAYKWSKNVQEGPVWDKDDYFLNFIAHPLAGAYYYMIARSSGFKFYESFLCATIMSTFLWEYGIEAFAEVPSYQDIIITPIVGSMIGEGFFYAKRSIIRHNERILNSRVLGKTTLFLIDPFNSVLDALGYKTKTETTLNIAPVSYNNLNAKPIWGLRLAVCF